MAFGAFDPILIDIFIKQKRNDLPLLTNDMLNFKSATMVTGQSQQQFMNQFTKMGYVVDEFGNIFNVATGKIVKQGEAFSSATQQMTRFKMHYLSLMFAGMLISRMTDKFMRDTVSTMMKMTEGQSQSAQALLSLTASWEYLKFSIGDAIGTALEPVLPYIVAIVDGFADFVQQNPEATFSAIFGLFAAGTTLMAIDQIGLFMQGLAAWRASPELMQFTSAGGGLEKLMKFAGAGIGFSLFFQGVTGLATADDVFEKLKSAGSALSGIATVGVALGKVSTKSGIALVTIGAVLEIISAVGSSDKKAFEASIKAALTQAGIMFVGIGLAGAGPGAIAVGGSLIILSVLWDLSGNLKLPTGTSLHEGTITIPGVINVTGINMTGGGSIPGGGSVTLSAEQNRLLNPTRGGDFIITKTGQFIQTSPQDTIYASKTGMAGVSVGNINITISTNNVSTENKDQLAREIGDKIVDEIKRYYR
jgi:hypothetical protein